MFSQVEATWTRTPGRSFEEEFLGLEVNASPIFQSNNHPRLRIVGGMLARVTNEA